MKNAEKNINGEEKIEEAANNKAVSSEQTEENIPQSIDQILERVNPQQREMVNRLVPGLIDYFRVLEAKVNYIGENALSKQWLEEQQKQVQAQQQAYVQPQTQQAGGLAGLVNTIPPQAWLQILGGSGSNDNFMAKYGEQMFQMQMESMKADISLTHAIKNNLMSKMGAEVAKKVEL